MEQIGLQAVLEDKDFQDGIKNYVKALDKAEKETTQTSNAMGKASIPSNKLTSAISGLKGSFTGLTQNVPVLGNALSFLANPLGLVTAGVGAFAAIAKDSVGDWVAYNKEIREMTQVTGLGAEEISKIVQVGDDWGISTGEIRSSLALMNKNGVKPSIENLAALADEYVNTADKTAFAEKASKLLGRGYQTLIPLLAKGGDALRKQTDAVDESLLATEESIKATREYEENMDALGDTVQGLKNELAQGLVPALNAVLSGFLGTIKVGTEVRNTMELYNSMVETGIITEEQALQVQKEMYAARYENAASTVIMTKAIEEATAKYEMAYPEEERLVRITEELATASGEAYKEITPLSSAIAELAGKFDEAKQMGSLLNDGIKFISESMVEQERIALVLEIATGNLTAAEIEEKLNALDRLEAMNNLNEALKSGAIDHYEWIGAMADGQVTQEEVNALLGITDDTLGGISGKVNGLDGMTANVKINIDVTGDPIPSIAINQKPGEPVPFRASGGPVEKEKPYIVGEDGPELFVPEYSGDIIPSQSISAMASGLPKPVDFSKLTSFWQIGDAISAASKIKQVSPLEDRFYDYVITAQKMGTSPTITIGPVTITGDMDMQTFTARVESAVLRALA
jgi:hypothetical protein